MKLTECAVGDIVGGMVETFTGHDSSRFELLYARIIRVNRKTVTIVDENGHQQRIDPYHLESKAPQYIVDALRDEGRLP